MAHVLLLWDTPVAEGAPLLEAMLRRLAQRLGARGEVRAIGGDWAAALYPVAADMAAHPDQPLTLCLFLRGIPSGAWQSALDTLRAYPQVEMYFFPFVPAGEGAWVDEVRRRWADRLVQLEQVTAENLDWLEQTILPSLLSFSAEPAEPAVPAVAAEPAVPAPLPEPPPPVTSAGVARLWQEIEPPADLTDRPPHQVAQALAADAGWRLIGASRRGKMHAHKGLFREDAFALGSVAGWRLLVVADGGGSCPLARVGARLAAETAAAQMARSLAAALPDAEAAAAQALLAGLEGAWQALAEEAQRRAVPLGHLGATFLALAHAATPTGDVVGVVQVGDGLAAAALDDGAFQVLADADVGTTAGATFFLTSRPWEVWRDRVRVLRLPQAARLLMLMCDGVADDLIPYAEHLPRLEAALTQVIAQPRPEQALLDLLGYERRGSFDDRTLALAYRGAEGK